MKNTDLRQGLLSSKTKITLAFGFAFLFGIQPSLAQLRSDKNVEVSTESGSINLVIDQTPSQELAKHSPDEIIKQANEEYMKAKRHNIAIETAREFPKETAVFFAALGLIYTRDLYLKYSNNPVALQQHIEALKDPVAHLSFYTFMLANRAASGPLMMAYGNRNLMRHVVPYIGMTVGMTASHIASELLYPLQQCMSDLTSNTKKASNSNPTNSAPQSCTQAYKDFVISEKILDMAPGLISMLASTAVTSAGQIGLVKLAQSEGGQAAKLATNQALKLVGINLVSIAVPGGIIFKAGQVIGKVVQVTGFVMVDHWMNPYITVPFNNFIKGRSLKNLSESITNKVISYDQNGWEPNSKENLLSHDLESFQKKMMMWRQLNLSTMLNSHDAWLKEVNNVTKMYSATYQFYSHIINELQAHDNKDAEVVSKLDRTYLLNGVLPTMPNPKEAYPTQGYLSGPAQAEKLQLITIKKVAELLSNVDQKGFFQNEKTYLIKLIDSFSKNDPKSLQAGLTLFSQLNDPGLNYKNSLSNNFKALMNQVIRILGNPQPLPEPGRGYLAAYSIHPTYSQTLELLENQSRAGRYEVKNPAEILALQLLCGPDPMQGDSLIKMTWGFGDTFSPPRLSSKMPPEKVCSIYGPPMPNHRLYNERFDDPQQSIGLINSIINNDEIRREFPAWWGKNVDPQMVKAFEVYGNGYKEIIVKFLEVIKQKSFDSANGGPIANGTLYSLKQEQRLYTLILSELFTSLLEKENKNQILNEISTKNEFGPALNDYLKKFRDGVPLMTLLLHNTPMDLGTLIYAHSKQIPPKRTSLIWGLQIDQKFQSLYSYLEKIEISSTESQKEKGVKEYKFLTQFTNNDIQELQSEIIESLKLISASLNLESDDKKPIVSNLTEEQKKIASLCISGLANVSQEVSEYLNIVNAISFDDGSKTKKEQSSSKSPCVKQGSMTTVGRKCN